VEKFEPLCRSKGNFHPGVPRKRLKTTCALKYIRIVHVRYKYIKKNLAGGEGLPFVVLQLTGKEQVTPMMRDGQNTFSLCGDA
jgi:hypothetical protein